MRVKEIRDMPSEERMKRLGEFRTELLRLRTMINAGGTIENPARIRELRKTIAQILTIENEQRQEFRKAETKEKTKK
jgi:large subunit ribosomal protein L29